MINKMIPWVGGGGEGGRWPVATRVNKLGGKELARDKHDKDLQATLLRCDGMAVDFELRTAGTTPMLLRGFEKRRNK